VAIAGTGLRPASEQVSVYWSALLATFVNVVKCDFSIWQAGFPARRKRFGKQLIRLAESYLPLDGSHSHALSPNLKSGWALSPLRGLL